MAWLTEAMRQGMVFFYELTGSYGLAIILLTVFIRLILLPLTWGQARSMIKMQALQPELKKLQKKYKDDPQTLNRETMALWRQHGVNPLSGCLGVLIQLPFLWAFFQMLNRFDYIGAASFLWVPNLGQPDPYWILPILAGVTTYWQTKSASPAGANDPSQRMMLYVFPVMIVWLSYSFAAGLSLYWVMSNLLYIAQTYATTRGIRPSRPRASA